MLAGVGVKRIMIGGAEAWSAVKDLLTGSGFTIWDDFEASTINTAIWSGSGGLISGGELKKNTANGTGSYWTISQFGSDDITVEVQLGTVTDQNQRSSVLLGSTAQYIYVEFSGSFGVLGDYNGSTWTSRNDFGGRTWKAGDRIKLIRSGDSLTLYQNTTVIATASSTVAKGTAFRRLGLDVRRDSNPFGTYYSPTFEVAGGYLTG